MVPRGGSNRYLIAFLSFVIISTMTGCGFGQPIAPALAPTPVGSLAPAFTPTPAPTNTATPIPTATIEPTPTAVPLPEGIAEVVSNASVQYRDAFESSTNFPKGWSSCTGFESVWSAEDGHLVVNAQPDKYGTVFYYADEMIDPNEAVYFLFAYEGNQGDFTLGFDGYVNGKVCDSVKGRLGFYSVALQHMPGLPLTVHSLINNDVKTSYFAGDWRLQEKIWYGALMGFDQSNTFFIDIWKPGDPGHKLVFKQTNADFPKTYNFISWLGVTRKMWIDDFTIIKFGTIK